jgi:hypothetical protein
MAKLLGRVMGKLNETAFRAWRRVVFANNAWKVPVAEPRNPKPETRHPKPDTRHPKP